MKKIMKNIFWAIIILSIGNAIIGGDGDEVSTVQINETGAPKANVAQEKQDVPVETPTLSDKQPVSDAEVKKMANDLANSEQDEVTNDTLNLLTIAQNEVIKHNGLKVHRFSARSRLNDWLNRLPAETKPVSLEIKGVISPQYQQTTLGDYAYYGELKDNMPHGFGVLLKVVPELRRSDMDWILTVGTDEQRAEVWKPVMLVYIGQFKNGQYNGYGLEFDVPDDELAGELLNNCVGLPNELYVPYMETIFNFVAYEGEFKDGQRHGKGNVFSHNALEKIISKYWATGEYFTPEDSFDVSVIVGEYTGGKLTGDAIVYSNGKKLYDGTLRKGEPNGKGVEYYENSTQVKYKGEYKKGQYHGKGTLYGPDGEVLYKGEWKNGDYE